MVNMIPTRQAKVRCRQVGDADLEAVADLLTRGFPGRPRSFWLGGLKRQGGRTVPPHCPRYGYLLESDGTVVGALLLICTSLPTGSDPVTRCNLSSWYVEPAFRAHASLLVSFALKQKGVTYVNISPAPHTWPTVEAQGFTPYSTGQFFALPALNRSAPGATIREFRPGTDMESLPKELAAMPDAELLLAHADYGCLCLVCTTREGSYPFVFLPFRIRSGRVPLPCMQLIYCRDTADFLRCAGAVGRYLLRRRAMPFVVIDSNGPIEGLTGTFRRARGRRYFKGPDRPRLGDLAYTELVLFGP
jgi:hypothetical protein